MTEEFLVYLVFCAPRKLESVFACLTSLLCNPFPIFKLTQKITHPNKALSTMYYSTFCTSFPAFNVLHNLCRTGQGQKQISVSLSKKQRTAHPICMIKRYLLQGHSNLVVSLSKCRFLLSKQTEADFPHFPDCTRSSFR